MTFAGSLIVAWLLMMTMDSNIGQKYFKKIDVWKRVDEKCLICFRCYELIGEIGFYVQGADYFYQPITKDQLLLAECQQVELFFDMDISNRTEVYPTLKEAIKAHESEFNI